MLHGKDVKKSIKTRDNSYRGRCVTRTLSELRIWSITIVRKRERNKKSGLDMEKVKGIAYYFLLVFPFKTEKMF